MIKQVAIITGSSRGIGKAIAAALIDQNYLVSMVSDDEQELQETAHAFPSEFVFTSYGDLADLEFSRSVVERTVNKWGRVDVLINNAAWRTLETLRTISIENWERTLAVCVTAPAFLGRWSAVHMEKQGSGVIINICSIMADRTGGTAAAYVASKGALLSLTYEMAALYGPQGIRVVAVSPGNISTKLSQEFTDEQGVDITSQLVEHYDDNTPLRRSGQDHEVAAAVRWLCSDQASYISGTNITIDGGFSRNFSAYPIKKLQYPNQF